MRRRSSRGAGACQRPVDVEHRDRDVHGRWRCSFPARWQRRRPGPLTITNEDFAGRGKEQTVPGRGLGQDEITQWASLTPSAALSSPPPGWPNRRGRASSPPSTCDIRGSPIWDWSISGGLSKLSRLRFPGQHPELRGTRRSRLTLVIRHPEYLLTILIRYLKHRCTVSLCTNTDTPFPLALTSFRLGLLSAKIPRNICTFSVSSKIPMFGIP